MFQRVAQTDVSGPIFGELVLFRGRVYIFDRGRAQPISIERGRFVRWLRRDGDAIAVVQTAVGRTQVRWSMLDGITWPGAIDEESI